MKIAYFDCFSGIAGDMTLAALLDCGASLPELIDALQTLPISGWEIQVESVLKSGIHALSVQVLENGVSDEEELAHARRYAGLHHEHTDDQKHHAGDHEHDHHKIQKIHGHHHGRSMAEIRQIITASGLSEAVKEKSLQIFQKIAVAEAFLHHSTPDEIHFHEIGGLDSLLDIVGVAWCLDYLKIEKIVCSPLPLSSGFVDCAHGRMPIPAPATLEMLQGAPWVATNLRGELVTPTGAGILAALAQWEAQPAMQLEKIGMGAGRRELPDRPNILRISLGTANQFAPLKGLQWQTLTLLETNVDDMNPQLFEAVFESCFGAGALDVWTTPIGMKKTRPATCLSVLCEPEVQNDVLHALLTQTTTLGVRFSSVSRAMLKREWTTVATPFGEVRLKIARWDEQNFSRAMPEWADVLKLAHKTGASAREIYNCALAASQPDR